MCRGHYEDYKDHVESEIHTANLKNSGYQAMIGQMCLKFQSSGEKK